VKLTFVDLIATPGGLEADRVRSWRDQGLGRHSRELLVRMDFGLRQSIVRVAARGAGENVRLERSGERKEDQRDDEERTDLRDQAPTQADEPPSFPTAMHVRRFSKISTHSRLATGIVAHLPSKVREEAHVAPGEDGGLPSYKIRPGEVDIPYTTASATRGLHCRMESPCPTHSSIWSR
jgi:hypothetical protein